MMHLYKYIQLYMQTICAKGKLEAARLINVFALILPVRFSLNCTTHY